MVRRIQVASRRKGKARVIVYIDGLNLYNGALRGSGNKWLDVEAWVRKILPARWEIIAIHYFTALVLGDPKSRARQREYLRALRAKSSVLQIHEGTFRWRSAVGKVEGSARRILRNATGDFSVNLNRVRVKVPRETETDVNLAAQMVFDAARAPGRCRLVLVANDGDFAGACAAAVKCGRRVVLFPPLLCGDRKLSGPLAEPVGRKNIRAIRRGPLADSQLPDVVRVPGSRPARKPPGW